MGSSRLVCSFIGFVIHLWNTPGLSAASRVNIALNGTAMQSSTWQNWHASEAINGNGDSDSGDYSCTHTLLEDKQWWRVQLPGVYKVAEIEVTNREYFKERIIGTEILIGNSAENFGNNNPRCAIISNSNRIQTFQCRGMTGRFVNFYNPCGPNIVTLCEVKVHGELVPPPPSTSTLVMGRDVTLVVGKRLCWSDAVLYCRDFHWDLLSIRGPEEQEMIQQLVARAPFPPTSHLWVGLRRSIMRSSWFWMTGEPMSFTQWEQGPVSSRPPSPCGSVASMEPSTWSQRYCDEHLNFICFTGPAEGVKKVRFYSSTRAPKSCAA